MATVPFVYRRGRDQNQEAFGGCKKTFRNSTIANGPSCVVRNPSGFFTISAILRPLELIPVSRERVVPTEWQVRTDLGDCISRAKVIPAPAAKYRQHALISDFVDLANLSFQQEPALATDWIKDGPEGLKLQNLTLATRTGRSAGSTPENPTADVHNAIKQMRKIGLRQTIDPSRESIGNCKGLFSAYGRSTSFFAECAFPVLYVTSGHPQSRL